MRRYLFALALTLLAAAGCSQRPSPLVGTWTGGTQTVKNDQSFFGLQTMVGEQAKGDGTLILKWDGTGFLKVSIFPERPISWTQEGEKVLFRDRGGEKTSISLTQSDDQTKSETSTLVGTLSPDQKSISIDYGYFTAVLHHMEPGVRSSSSAQRASAR